MVDLVTAPVLAEVCAGRAEGRGTGRVSPLGQVPVTLRANSSTAPVCMSRERSFVLRGLNVDAVVLFSPARAAVSLASISLRGGPSPVCRALERVAVTSTVRNQTSSTAGPSPEPTRSNSGAPNPRAFINPRKHASLTAIDRHCPLPHTFAQTLCVSAIAPPMQNTIATFGWDGRRDRVAGFGGVVPPDGLRRSLSRRGNAGPTGLGARH